MIFDSIINLVVYVVGFFVGLLPNADSTITSNIATYMANFKADLVQANYAFPVDTLLTVITIMLGVEIVIFLWHTIVWLGRALHIIG